MAIKSNNYFCIFCLSSDDTLLLDLFAISVLNQFKDFERAHNWIEIRNAIYKHISDLVRRVSVIMVSRELDIESEKVQNFIEIYCSGLNSI
jgi:hypothetical protein